MFVFPLKITSPCVELHVETLQMAGATHDGTGLLAWQSYSSS